VLTGDPSKYKMLIPDVSPRFIPSHTSVPVKTDKIDLWVVNHDSQATSPESKYSFVAQHYVDFTCKKTHVNKWSGEGTVQAEYYDAGPVGRPYEGATYTARGTNNGVFTFTFTVQDGCCRIVGEGAATVTSTKEFAATSAPSRPPGDIHCTGTLQTTGPFMVEGNREHGTLRLTYRPLDGSDRPIPFPWSCTGPGARFGGPKLSVRHPFIEMMPPRFKVSAEDGATGVVENPLARPIGAKGKALWSMRIKALPPEGGGSRPVSGGTGQSLSEFPGPSLPDY